MLRVNLNMLLAERNLTASRLSKETGISKTTLTSLVNNTGKGIQYDTIDTICNFLGVTPNDFFDYVPADYVFDYESIKFLILGEQIKDPEESVFYLKSIEEHYFNFYVDIKQRNNNDTFVLNGEAEVIKNSNIFDKYNLNQIRLNLNFLDNNVARNFDEAFYRKISKGHQSIFNKNANDFIIKSFKEVFEEEFDAKDARIEGFDFENIIVDLPWDLPF